MWSVGAFFQWIYDALDIVAYARGERYEGEFEESAACKLSLDSLPKVVNGVGRQLNI